MQHNVKKFHIIIHESILFRLIVITSRLFQSNALYVFKNIFVCKKNWKDNSEIKTSFSLTVSFW